MSVRTQHPEHRKIVEAIESLSGKPHHDDFLNHYLGTTHPVYNIRNPDLRNLLKEWKGGYTPASATDYINVLTSLVSGATFNEKIAAGMLLNSAWRSLRSLSPDTFSSWITWKDGRK